MGSEQLVIIILASLVIAQSAALLWAFARSASAALSINDDWREAQRLRLDTDRAEFMLREARRREGQGEERAARMSPRGDAMDVTTGPLG